MKFVYLVLFVLTFQISATAQITYNFTSNATAATGLPANITAPTGSIISGNTGATVFLPTTAATPASSGYTGFSGGANGNLTAAVGTLNTATSAYVQITLTPSTGYAVNITAINWGNYSISTTGPTTYSIRTNVDNYAANINTAAITGTANSSWGTTVLTSALTSTTAPAGAPLIIRIYASGGTGTPTAGTANWRVDDIKITATAVLSSASTNAGTINNIPKYLSSTTLGNSQIVDNGTSVGVGTATPDAAAKLDISGQIKITGGTPGLNKVLTSDANGLATWQTPAAGGTNYWTLTGANISNNNTGNVIINSNLSSPGTGANSERFGLGSSTGTATNALALGNTATASGNNAIAIGKGVTSSFIGSIALGNNVTPPADNNIAIGNNINTVGNVGIGLNLAGGNLNIGSNNNASTNHTSILIGSGLVATGQNELRIGSANAGWWPTQIYLSGATANPLASAYGDQTLIAISGSGTNIAGQGMRFKAGKSTGSAKGGEISFFTTPAGVAGVTENTEQERLRISADGNVGIGTTTPTAKLEVNGNFKLVNGTQGAGKVLTSDANGLATWAAPSGGGSGPWTESGVNIYNTTLANNVGIGIAVPTAKLDVNGTFNVSGITNFNALGFSTGAANLFNSGTNTIAAKFGSGSTVGFAANDYGGAIRFNGAGVAWGDVAFFPNGGGAGSEGNFRFSTTGSVLNTSPSGKVGVGDLYVTNNVGIGVTAPFAKLDVSSAINVRDYSGLTGGAPGNVMQIIRGMGPSGNIEIGGGNNGDIILKNHVTESMRVTPSGVAVGTTTIPVGYKMAVKGNIIAEKLTVKLYANWPDYVFDENYNLMPLNQLEQYILQNKHLPNMPTAVQTEKDGIDVGANQTLLLQKVEELTLYAIDANKKINEQQKQIEELKKQQTQIQLLQDELNKLKKQVATNK